MKTIMVIINFKTLKINW